jgi:hypothetical protein
MLLNRIALLVLILGGLAALVANYLQSSRLSRRRTRVVLAGTIFGVAPPLIVTIAFQYFNLPQTSLLIVIYFIIYSLFLLLPLSFVYAIARQVIPISLIIRRSARYLFVSRGSIVLEALAVGLTLAF